MMKITNNTIGRFTWTVDGKNHEVVGVVLYTPDTHEGDKYCFLDMDGKYNFCPKHIPVFVKAIRIAPETRTALTKIAEEYNTLLWMKAQLSRLKTSIFSAEDSLKGLIKDFTAAESERRGLYTYKQVEEMVSANGMTISSHGFIRDSQSQTITISVSNQGERYSKNALPHPFMYMEYDGAVFADRDCAPKAYDEYATRYSPSTNEKLAKICKLMGGAIEKSVSAGDKYLYATTSYTLPFKKGFVRQDVDNVISALA